MTYQEALNYIHSVSWKGSVPGLERIGELCSLLGDPQKKLNFIHIAGTNGKGSVCAMLTGILCEAGLRVGTFTSPYLLDFCERIALNGKNIPHEALAAVTDEVRVCAEKMTDKPTEFELITAIAFVYFARENCDIVVLECGMGGRLDSTNIIPSPLVSVITNIALDHTAVLGDTEEKIACEKAGIIKSAPVIIGNVKGGAREVIEDIAKERGVPTVHASDVAFEIVETTPDGIYTVLDGNDYRLPLCGAYQVSNLKVVFAALGELEKLGITLNPDVVKRGLAGVRWIGRFETLCKSIPIIYDGAHNPDGAAYTTKTFRALYPGQQAIVVSGVMADKNYTEVASLLAEIAECFITVTPDNPRALPADDYAAALREMNIDATASADIYDGIKKAIARHFESGAPILCAGSLYMYGEIYRAVEAAGREFDI